MNTNAVPKVVYYLRSSRWEHAKAGTALMFALSFEQVWGEFGLTIWWSVVNCPWEALFRKFLSRLSHLKLRFVRFKRSTTSMVLFQQDRKIKGSYQTGLRLIAAGLFCRVLVSVTDLFDWKEWCLCSDDMMLCYFVEPLTQASQGSVTEKTSLCCTKSWKSVLIRYGIFNSSS